jgi:hypothetical protein
MKRYLIPTVVILFAMTLSWPVLGQREGRGAGQGRQGRAGQGRMQGFSEEERARMRERWQNMSEDERQQFRAQMRERFASRMPRMSSEEQLKAIEVIEKELAKLKANIERPAFDRSRFREMSEEERTKLREQMRTARQERQAAFRTIIAQIAMLQGQRQPTTEGEEFIIINTSQLKAIQELAVKEKAKETADRLTSLLESPQRGMGGRSRQGQMGQPDISRARRINRPREEIGNRGSNEVP